jgi:hypothetical protein
MLNMPSDCHLFAQGNCSREKKRSTNAVTGFKAPQHPQYSSPTVLDEMSELAGLAQHDIINAALYLYLFTQLRATAFDAGSTASERSDILIKVSLAFTWP